MTQVNLRSYNREINQMIEDGRSSEAIGHCLYILEQFSRHVETYRLLGTAYLDKKHYSDAGDIFLRVLSVIPDDLVAHIGLSVIKEHENQIDPAIWHMERAYEIQPANRVLKDELLRLYGLRDGIEPPRTYLTRGALARMYIRGNLFPQAIAELTNAIAEEPNRIDLQLLLARTYTTVGRTIEAITTSQSILIHLPNCLEANRIIIEQSTEQDQQDQLDIYYQRIESIDPYFKYISPDAPTSDQVVDEKVILTRFSGLQGKAADGTRVIDESLVHEITSHPTEKLDQVSFPEKDPLPDWIVDVEPERTGIDVQENQTLPGETTSESVSKTTEVPFDEEDTKPTLVRPIDDPGE